MKKKSEWERLFTIPTRLIPQPKDNPEMIAFVGKLKKNGKYIREKRVSDCCRMSAGDIIQFWKWNNKEYKLIYEDNMNARDRAWVLSKVFSRNGGEKNENDSNNEEHRKRCEVEIHKRD